MTTENPQQTTEQRDVATHHLDDAPEYEYDVGQSFKLRDDPDPEGYIMVKARVWNYDADLDDAMVKLLAYKQYLVGDVVSLGGNERLVTEDALKQHYEPVAREEAKEVLEL
jgi:hypothetical protein